MGLESIQVTAIKKHSAGLISHKNNIHNDFSVFMFV